LSEIAKKTYLSFKNKENARLNDGRFCFTFVGKYIKSMAKKTSAGGRPTLYKEEYNKTAYKLCLLGATDAALADFFEVNVDTVNEWKIKHPEFSVSIKRGKSFADATIAESLYNRAKGAVVKVQQAVKIVERKPVINKKTGEPTRSVVQTEKVQIVQLEQELPPDTVAGIFWLKNRQPKEWRDKQEVVHTNIEQPLFPDEE